MRRISIILTALLLFGSPYVEAQHSTTSSGRNSRRQPTEQPSHNKRPAGTNHRPGSDNHNSSRPRPENRPQQPQRPQRPHKPQQPQRPQQPPTMRPRPEHRPIVQPPHRPSPPRPIFHRPARPSGWHYAPGAPSLGQIVGFAIGSAFSSAINTLAHQGITYTPYGNEMVYVTNVSQYGYLWPEATLYYTNGLLTGGRFDYYESQASQHRYNQLYRYFTGIWGQPYSASGTQLTWFTPDNGFVSLATEYTGGRFLTSLTVGQ